MTHLQDHPEYHHLVNAVRAAPDDDLPRLVLADWLEEHDAPDWAEFIRCHCEAARHPHAARIWADTFTDADAVNPDWQRALTAARRVRELWPDVAYIYWGRWDERLKTRVQANGRCVVDHPRREFPQSFEVRRGFVERVECAAAQWIGEMRDKPLGPRLVARQPVWEAWLTDRNRDDERTWDAFECDDHVSETHRELIPWCIARRLSGAEGSGTEQDGDTVRWTWWYSTPDAANAALSAAAIAWALEEAGRPTL